jgi:hypothetical protein
MHIDVVPNRGSAPAILLRESYREDGKTKKRTLTNLSAWPAEQIEQLRAVLRGERLLPASEAIEIVRALPHGHVLAALGTARRIDLEGLLPRRASQRRCDLALALIIARLLDPAAKLATARMLDTATASSSLGEVLQLGRVTARELYATLDWLESEQPFIETTLARRHLTDGTLLLYDVTSTYLEGRRCELAQYGYSRDHRSDRPQLVIGLLCAANGCPVAVEVFDGNTADPATLTAQIDAAITAEAALDGIYVLRTNLPAEQSDAAATVRAYKSLAHVEHAFRSLKTVDLELRPVFHWTARRVRGHVLLCMLAYYLEWHMRQCLAPLLFDEDDPAAGEAQRASPVQKAKPSLATRHKAASKQTDPAQGEPVPVHSFHTLLADLATLTRNVVRLGRDRLTAVLATPTKVQRKAFELLGVAIAA